MVHITKSYKLNTTKMTNNKSYKIKTTRMTNNNKKRDYNTGVADGTKMFLNFFNGSTMI